MKDEQFAVALDLGTTAIKASLIDSQGHVRAVASHECVLETPGPNMVEQDPDVWYGAACEMIKKAVSSVNASQVLGVGISSQGISFVLTDERFQPITKGISWLDTRAKAQAKALMARYPVQEWFKKTGKYSAEGYTLSSLLWMFENNKELRSAARHCLMPLDYAVARLTGNAVSERTMWAGSLMLDLQTQAWDLSLLEEMGIDPQILPELRDTGSIAGYLTEEAAARCGLLAGTPVIAAGQDQKTAAYGANICNGMATLSLGTAGAMEVLTTRCEIDPRLGITICPFMTRDTWVIETCVNTVGAAIKWVRNTIFPDLSYKELDALCAEAPVGSDGVWFLPFLTAPGTPHVQCELDGGYRALTLGATRADLARALFEGLAYELRLNVDAVHAAGENIQMIAVFGGASRGDPFCQMLADVMDLPLKKYPTEEMVCIGAAKMVFAAMDGNLEEFDAGVLENAALYQPQPDVAQKYRTLYSRYQKFLQ